MDSYEVELEPAEPDGFAAIVPALPGLLVLGRDIDEVLERVRAAIDFHVGRGPLPARLIVSQRERGELLGDLAGLGRGQGKAHTREAEQQQVVARTRAARPSLSPRGGTHVVPPGPFRAAPLGPLPQRDPALRANL